MLPRPVQHRNTGHVYSGQRENVLPSPLRFLDAPVSWCPWLFLYTRLQLHTPNRSPPNDQQPSISSDCLLLLLPPSSSAFIFKAVQLTSHGHVLIWWSPRVMKSAVFQRLVLVTSFLPSPSLRAIESRASRCFDDRRTGFWKRALEACVFI